MSDDSAEYWTIGQTRVKRVVAVIYLIGVIFAANMVVCITFLPFAYKEAGFTAVEVGYVQMASAAAELVGGPVGGYVSDRYGLRRAILVPFFASTLVAYLVLCAATSLFWLLVAASLFVFMSLQQSATALLAASTTADERPAALGRLQATIAVGAVIGSIAAGALGALLTKLQIYCIILAMCAVGIALVVAFVPARVAESAPKKDKDEEEKEAVSDKSVGNYLSVLRDPNVRRLLLLKTAAIAPIWLLNSVQSWYLIERFDVIPAQQSTIMTVTMAVNILCQTVVIGRVRKRFGQTTCLKMALAGCLVGCVGLAAAQSFWMYLGVRPLLTAINGLLMILLDSQLTVVAAAEDRGKVVGLGAALMSGTRLIAAPVSGYALYSYGYAPIALAGAAVYAAVFLVTNAWDVVGEKPEDVHKPKND